MVVGKTRVVVVVVVTMLGRQEEQVEEKEEKEEVEELLQVTTFMILNFEVMCYQTSLHYF